MWMNVVTLISRWLTILWETYTPNSLHHFRCFKIFRHLAYYTLPLRLVQSFTFFFIRDISDEMTNKTLITISLSTRNSMIIKWIWKLRIFLIICEHWWERSFLKELFQRHFLLFVKVFNLNTVGSGWLYSYCFVVVAIMGILVYNYTRLYSKFMQQRQRI